MRSYMHYVHDIPEESHSWFAWSRTKKKAEDFRVKIESKNDLQRAILNETNQTVLNYVSEHLDLERNFKSIVFSTHDKSYVENVDFNNVRAIINFKEINDIRHVNHHFRSVNILLPDAGIYIGRAETYWERKIRIYRKYGNRIGQLIWLVDFVFNRVLPKLRPFDKIYRLVTNNHVHPKSVAELLGRLVYCGFEIIEFNVIDNLAYFVAIKTREPMEVEEPTYHLLAKLRRLGKGGKMITVYKLRTMHPYSEFLQDFVIKLNGYNKSGKPARDFRVARWGKFFRRFWIDELPQLINVLKGEMKLVGVRPLSRTRFNEFPEDIQQERLKYKPGCVPPYVALNMPDEYENMEAERIYFRDILVDPLKTDIRYFLKSIWNILTNKIIGS